MVLLCRMVSRYIHGHSGSESDLRCLPAVGTEEQVNDMIVHLDLAHEVVVDHLPDGRCPVCACVSEHSTCACVKLMGCVALDV